MLPLFGGPPYGDRACNLPVSASYHEIPVQPGRANWLPVNDLFFNLIIKFINNSGGKDDAHHQQTGIHRRQFAIPFTLTGYPFLRNDNRNLCSL